MKEKVFLLVTQAEKYEPVPTGTYSEVGSRNH
jgi:hypothetical protein